MSAPRDRKDAGTGAPDQAPEAQWGGVRSYGPAMREGMRAYPPAQGSEQMPGSIPAQHAGHGWHAQMPAACAGAYRAPLTSQPVEARRKSRKGIIIALAIALIAAALAIALALTMCTDAKSRRQGDAGQLAGKSEAEVRAELDRVVEEGMFNISIASVIELDHGSAPAELRIENVPGNRYLMRVTIMRNDTGEQIYATDLIEPDHHIQRDALDVVLPAGSYECTALFEALDETSEEPVGQAAAIVTLNVLS